MQKLRAIWPASSLSILLAVATCCFLWREGDMLTVAFAQTPAVPAENRDRPRQATPLEREIEQILVAQQQAWNRGDLEAFMQHYLKSDELTFSSGGRVTRGWQATLANYEQRYPDRAAMGKLEFSAIEVRRLGETAALVLGNWQLERQEGPDIGGNFTLVLDRIDDHWLIVHDHTSRRDPPAEAPQEQPQQTPRHEDR